MKVSARYVAAFLTLALCLAPVYDLAGRSKKKKEKTETVSVKKTPYEEFLSKKGLVSARGGSVSVLKDGDKVYIEFPDSLMGSELCLSSHVLESSDVMLAEGLNVSGKSTDFRIYRTDSLVVFRIPKTPVLVSERDSSTLKAFDLSVTEAVKYAFPIKYRNSDSTAVVFDATELFDCSEDATVNLYASWFGSSQIAESTKVDELSELKDVMAFPESVAVVQDATFDVKLATGHDARVSTAVVTTLSVLGDNLMPVRKADSRIGLMTTAGQHFDSKEGFKKIRLANRWDLRDGKKIRVYVDTLMPLSWQKAVGDGLRAWNPAFEKAGLGADVVEVLPYSSDSTFSAFNPAVSTVSLCGGGGREIHARISTDSRTGEIRRFSMSIPGNYLLSLLFSTSFTIGDVDSRYLSYNLPDDAVCDVIRAQTMKIFGRGLGLGRNCAGSLAYTPEELRSPEFTQKYGITASVLDNVLFNTLARPGDKERGVVTIVDRIGPYDEYAIEWLYGSYSNDSVTEESLDSLVCSKIGKREFLYVPLQQNSPDPRPNEYDLGSDPFAAFDAAMSHLHFAAANADKWFASPDIPEEEFKQLYVEWIWLKMIDNLKILSPLVGGIISDDVRAGSEETHFKAVPEAVQREAVRRILSTLTDVSWLDANKNLMTMSGAYATYSGLTYMNLVGQSRLLSRLPYIARAQRLAGSTYTREKFLSDFQDTIFANLRKGRLGVQEDDMIIRYLRALMLMSPVLKTNFDTAFRINEKSFDDGLFLPLSGVSVIDMEGQDVVAKKALENARKTLISGRSHARDPHVAGKIDYLIYCADVALGKK